MKRSIWLGYEPREQDAFEVCVASIREHLSEDIPIFALALAVLHERGLYDRPTLYRDDGGLYDVISDAPMSTEHAISRFFLPHLNEGGLALFMDCDTMVRTDLAELFALADPAKAIHVVQHNYKPAETVKMDGQAQLAYARKNWSSVMLWNLDHPAHRQLTMAKLNTWAGRALHRFAWLEDREIGELEPAWNHLVGVHPRNPDAKIVHFTLGTPSMPGYEFCEHAEEWRARCRPV